jgi:hypothetical protein
MQTPDNTPDNSDIQHTRPIGQSAGFWQVAKQVPSPLAPMKQKP